MAGLLWLVGPGELAAQTVWSGPPLVFTKIDGADWSLPENQDRLTDDVWLTRANLRGLFNINREPGYDSATGNSPLGTEWAFAGLNGNPTAGVTASNHENLQFDTWVDSLGAVPPAGVGRAGVMHLVDEDIYLDITFLSWDVGAGGYSYSRSTVPEPGALGVVAALLCAAGAAWRRVARAASP